MGLFCIFMIITLLYLIGVRLLISINRNLDFY